MAMQSQIKFSVVVPVHNGMPYFQQCLQSILSQDYPDFNVFVLENASTDGTEQYLKELDDKRIVIVPSTHLLTIEENWSRIITLPCNKYMTIVMADDYIRSDYLSILAQTIQRHPGHPIYRTNITAVDSESMAIYQSQIKSKISKYDYLRGRLTHTYFETAAGYCFKWSRYLEIGGIDCRFRLMSTDDKLIMEAIGSNTMIVAPEHAAFYRCHSGSESGCPNAEAELAGYKYFFKWLHAQNDKKIDAIIRNYLPFHLQVTGKFYSPDGLAQHKALYTLFGITSENGLSWQWNRLKIRFLTLGTLIHKVITRP